MTPIKKIPATLLSRRTLNDTYVELDLELAEPTDFEVGQYLSLKVGSLFRPYSIASVPDGKKVTLCIDTTPGGVGSLYAASTPIGTTTEVLIPMGKFVLSGLPLKTLFIATGSGIAPFKPMLETLLTKQKVTYPVELYWGMKTKAKLFWHEHWEALQTAYPNFSYTYCLSKEENKGESVSCFFSGRVTHHLEQQTDFKHAQAYLCGSGEMVDITSQLLLDRGMHKEHIYFEKYN